MRLIDADQMLADEKEAYYAAQPKIDDTIYGERREDDATDHV